MPRATYVCLLLRLKKPLSQLHSAAKFNLTALAQSASLQLVSACLHLSTSSDCLQVPGPPGTLQASFRLLRQFKPSNQADTSSGRSLVTTHTSILVAVINFVLSYAETRNEAVPDVAAVVLGRFRLFSKRTIDCTQCFTESVCGHRS